MSTIQSLPRLVPDISALGICTVGLYPKPYMSLLIQESLLLTGSRLHCNAGRYGWGGSPAVAATQSTPITKHVCKCMNALMLKGLCLPCRPGWMGKQAVGQPLDRCQTVHPNVRTHQTCLHAAHLTPASEEDSKDQIKRLRGVKDTRKCV